MSPEIVPGRIGEFSVWVHGRRVTHKRLFRRFPEPPDVVHAVRRALAP